MDAIQSLEGFRLFGVFLAFKFRSVQSWNNDGKLRQAIWNSLLCCVFLWVCIVGAWCNFRGSPFNFGVGPSQVVYLTSYKSSHRVCVVCVSTCVGLFCRVAAILGGVWPRLANGGRICGFQALNTRDTPRRVRSKCWPKKNHHQPHLIRQPSA